MPARSATAIAGFRAYHRDNARTREHLALSRACVIAADDDFGFRVDAAVGQVMARARDAAATIADVVAMRALMAKERPARHPFDLKLAKGGSVDLEFIAQSAQLVAGSTVALPQALTAQVLARLGQTGLVPQGMRLAEIHEVYSTVLQVMSSAPVSPFKEEAWTAAFKELLAGLTHYPDFGRLELDSAAMRAEVQEAADARYEKAKGV
ncbi:hypothetical protein N8D56_21555 [Devosia sp. A8/3-2]|nr:hypothetical protein N8D56_21555 [Devosia sp. A8/3-2]